MQSSDFKLKHIIAYLVMETNDINHTALYKTGEVKEGFKLDTFKRLFYTSPGRGKDVTSREHDEIISGIIPLLGLHVFYRETHTKKNTRRFAIIYKKIISTEAEINEAKREMEDFYRHYRRREGTNLVLFANRVSDIVLT